MMNDKDILTLLLTKGLGPKSVGRIIDMSSFKSNSSWDISAMGPNEITGQFKIRHDIAKEVHNTIIKAEALLSEFRQSNIKILVRGREEYPKALENSLGPDAPPILFAKGALNILNKKAVGFCGSRNASEKGIAVAQDCASELAKHDIAAVSGYAHGVDMAAHKAALESGGSTVFVLAEGILHFKLKREVKDLATDENHLVISEFLPRLPWIARNAMQRNKTICGLSNAVVIIESGVKGGTFEAGKTALELKRPLFVVEYSQPAPSAEGNNYFIGLGATALRKKNGHANLESLFKAVENSADETKPYNNDPQKSLFHRTLA
jgi:DNA protecting protein DprA